MKKLRKKQLCSITGVTSETLRYYVEKGIITPGRENNGNYYSYSLGDAAMLLQARQLRGFGVPMDRIPDQLEKSSVSWEKHETELREQYETLLCEKRKLERNLQILAARIDASNVRRNTMPYVFHAGSPYYAAFYDGSAESMTAVSQLQSFMPRSMISFRLKPGCAPEIGLTVEHNSLFEEETGLLSPSVFELGCDRILQYRHYEDIASARMDDYQDVLEFCDYHRLTVTSDVFCVSLRLYDNGGKIGGEFLGGVTYDLG